MASFCINPCNWHWMLSSLHSSRSSFVSRSIHTVYLIPPYFALTIHIWCKRVTKPDRKSYLPPGLAIRGLIQIEPRLTCPGEYQNPGMIQITVPCGKGDDVYQRLSDVLSSVVFRGERFQCTVITAPSYNQWSALCSCGRNGLPYWSTNLSLQRSTRFLLAWTSPWTL